MRAYTTEFTEHTEKYELVRNSVISVPSVVRDPFACERYEKKGAFAPQRSQSTQRNVNWSETLCSLCALW
jgi:hypothetical protein